MKRSRKIKCAVFIAAVVLFIVSAVVYMYSHGKTRGVSDLGISTEAMNNCLAYDAEDDITVIGTNSDNKIYAFKSGGKLWENKGSGAFSRVVIRPEKNLVIAGNQDNNIYIYGLDDGTLQKTINVQRRVVSIDVNEACDRIAAATLTGTSKTNVLVYDFDGNELGNVKYSVKVSGVHFADDDTIIIGNNRGELKKIDYSGEDLGSYETNYSVFDFFDCGDQLLVLCKNGGYFFIDNDLNVLRQGKIDNTVHATPASIGTDAEKKYVAVGSEEGYLFIMDDEDKQIYQADEEEAITSFAADGNHIMFTGNGNYVKNINTEDISGITRNRALAQISMILLIISGIISVFTIFLVIPKTDVAMTALGKEMWRCRAAYLLLLPGLILMWLFNYQGILTAFIRSFTNWSVDNNTLAEIDFIGLDNFKSMLTEGYFLVGMKNLLILLLAAVIKVLTVPLLCAWLCFSATGNKRKYVHRFLFVLPIVVPSVISAMIWLKIYDPNIGLINELLKAMGLSNLTRVWLGDSSTALGAIIFMGFPFVNAMAFLVYYGGL